MHSRAISLLARKYREDAEVRLGLTAYHAGRAYIHVERFARETGVRSIDRITAGAAIAWLAALGRKGLAFRTRRNLLSSLRAFTRWLVETERLKADPISSVRMGRAPPARGSRALPVSAMRALIAQARRDLDDRDRRRARWAPARLATYLVLATTGLRIGELAAQAWADVDLDRGTLRLTRDKARRADLLPLSAQALAALRWWRGQHDGTGRVFPSIPCTRTLWRDLRRAGLPVEAGAWHRWRKGSITALAEAGAPVWDLAAFARHSDPSVTLRHYITSVDDRLRRTADLLPRLLAPGAHLPEKI